MTTGPANRPRPRAARPRQARSERTRGRILDAALALLADGGPAAVTHRAVAERARVSLGAVTYHFASKVDLLEAIHRLHLARVRERVEALGEAFGEPSAAGAPHPGRLAAGVLRYLEQGVHGGREASLATFELSLERARDPELRRRLRAASAGSLAYAEERLAAFGAREPNVDAELLIAALDGLRLAWLSQGVRSGFAKRIPALVQRLAGLLSSSD